MSECLARGQSHSPCGGKIDKHHIRLGHYARSQPDDKYCVPLCRIHHTLLHNHGEAKFWIELMAESYQVLAEVMKGYAENLNTNQ